MSDLRRLQQALGAVARRQRWQNGARGAWHGLFLGAWVWLVGLLLFKLAPLPVAALSVAGVGGGTCVLVGFVRGFVRRPRLLEVARLVDRAQHLDECLSTALEVAEQQPDSDWCRLLLAQAADCGKVLDPKRLLPWRLPPVCRGTILVLALVAALGFVPEYRSASFRQRQRDAAGIRAAGETLASLARRTLEGRPPALDEAREGLESLEQLGRRLADRPLARAEALRDLSNVAERLRAASQQLTRDPVLRRLEQAARQNRGATADAAALAQQVESLQKPLGNQNTLPEKLGGLKSSLEQLHKQAAALPEKDSPEGAGARRQLAQSLAALGRQMGELGLSLDGLPEALAALAADQAALLTQHLNQMLTDLEQLRLQAMTLQQVRQQAAQPGRDLAEQLQRGQAEAAAATLQRMVRQLQSSHLSPEQLRRVLEEVRQALEPAQPYGPVADHLSQAVRQMQQGHPAGAAQSLAGAAHELQKLLDQLADAEALAGALQALQRAQLAVASGQSLGACRQSGWGETQWTGLTGGSGAGTATNPDDLFHPADPLLPENPRATRIRGQLTPGAPLPGIPLKGVGLTGTSHVPFEEAAAAAQADAQSALNQDQIPRAYRKAVRDYFDELRK